MPRLIPPEFGNGRRPSDPEYRPSGSETAVPVLDVSEETHELVGQLHDAALDPDDDDHELLVGVKVYLDNARPREVTDASAPRWTRVTIGGSTTHEAATEVIGAFAQVALDQPQWVASTNDDLAKILAEHFTVQEHDEKGKVTSTYSVCKVIKMSEVPQS